jgi:hypothetical protein
MSAVPGWTANRTPPPWTRDEFGALFVAAGLGPLGEHALVSLLALNGLRVPEATGPAPGTWAWNAGAGLTLK